MPEERPPIEEPQVEVEALLPQSEAPPEAEVERLREELARRAREVEGLRAQLARALERYRQALQQLAPEVPGELLQGETVEEVEASFQRALSLVERLRRELAERASLQRVPPGAPPRTAPDLSALPPREKILHGLRRLAQG